jgi:hypothetical protein
VVSQQEYPNRSRTSAVRVEAGLEVAWQYYTLPQLHARGLGYLRSRGIDVGVLETYTRRTEIGHTPAPKDGLVRWLRGEGFSDDELVDAGLAYRRLGALPVTDFYRQRALIPLRNHEGRSPSPAGSCRLNNSTTCCSSIRGRR